MANDTGVYEGHNQEYSGNGYVNMHFEARTITQAEFEVWIQKAKQSSDSLSMANDLNSLIIFIVVVSCG